MGLDFPAAYRKWASVPPVQLFDAPTVRTIDEVPTWDVTYRCRSLTFAGFQSKQNIADNLKHFGRSARELVIWTDCDREGEAIGQEIVDTVREVNQNVTVYRARFSVLQPQ